MAIKQVFKSQMASCSYAFSKGGIAYFNNYKYLTDKPSEIEELNQVISDGSNQLYIDENEKELDADINPMETLKAAIIAEFLAKQKEVAENPDRDLGTSTQTTQVSGANSRTLGKLAAGAGEASSGTANFTSAPRT